MAQALLRTASQARVIGFTGPPGAGKSTLVDALVAHYRRRDQRVAVLAVDPNSPATGGAVLGDRIRMQRHSTDEGVFIRSMGSRGRTDGVAPAVRDSCRILAATGHDPILIETVGVGQTELGIVECCDLRVLVLAPAWGDYVQASKAGLIEMVDLVVVNKADLPGAASLAEDLRQAVDGRHGRAIPAVRACAGRRESGIEDAVATITALSNALAGPDLAQRRLEATCAELLNRALSAFVQGSLQRVADDGTARRLAAAVCDREISAGDAAAQLYRAACGKT